MTLTERLAAAHAETPTCNAGPEQPFTCHSLKCRTTALEYADSVSLSLVPPPSRVTGRAFSRFFVDGGNRTHVMLHDRADMTSPEFTVGVTAGVGELSTLVHYTPAGLRALIEAAQAGLAALDAVESV